ncbi:MAG: hypothetical protein GY953_01805, partial [bacterium]|nr:hypothetical protein [bacterium]
MVRYLTLAGDTDSAIEQTRLQVRAIRDRAGQEPADLAGELYNFGRSLNDEGLWPAGELPLLEALAAFEGMTEPDSDIRIRILVQLCESLAAQGKQSAADQRLAQAEALVIEAHGESSLEHASDVLYSVGRRYSQVDRGAEAVPLFRRASASCRAVGEEGIDDCRRAERRLGRELALLGETKEAMRIAREQIDYWRMKRGNTHWAIGEARMTLGLVHLRAGSLDAA